jgi:hypothetical protein
MASERWWYAARPAELTSSKTARATLRRLQSSIHHRLRRSTHHSPAPPRRQIAIDGHRPRRPPRVPSLELVTKDPTERSVGLRIPAAEIEQLVTSRVRQWLLDPGSIYQAIPLPDPSAQHRLVARAGEIGKSWPELPGTRQRAFLTLLIERIDVGANQIDIHFRPTRLGALLDVAAPPLDETQILSVPARLRRSGRSR